MNGCKAEMFEAKLQPVTPHLQLIKTTENAPFNLKFQLVMVFINIIQLACC